MLGDFLAILRKAMELLASWLESRTREQNDENRRDIAADGSGALIGLFNPGKDSSAQTHSDLDGQNESGR